MLHRESYNGVLNTYSGIFYGTPVPWTRVPCNFFFFFLNFSYSCVSWRPIMAFLMELEFFFFLSLIAPYSIFYKSSFTLKLDFEKIKFQNMNISLISLEKWTKRWFFCTKRAFAHFLRKVQDEQLQVTFPTVSKSFNKKILISCAQFF